MRVLILSCNTGEGHNSAAAAVKKAMEDNGVYCEVKDALAFISKGWSSVFSHGHVLMYRHAPWLFKFGYHSAEKHRGIFKEKSLIYRFFGLGAKKLYNYLQNGNFDVIIAPHVFAALMVSTVKKRYGLQAKTYFLSTDYTCSPSTEQSNLDTYFIPSDLLSEEFVGCDIPREKLVASGIPVRKDFFVFSAKEDAKKALGLSADKIHLLMMCGSMGCGPMKRLAKKLSKMLTDKQELTIICGTNKHLFKRLNRKFKSIPNIYVKGFADNVSLFMDSADIYITKPGGISTSEAAVKGLPMVFINAVAGCEIYNMHYFIQHGGAVTAEGVTALANICMDIATNPNSLKNMSAAVKAVSPPDSSEFIFNYIYGENN